MPTRPELNRLRTAQTRPYAVELTSQADSAAVITAYAEDRPIVLWGEWLESELILGIDPLVELSGLDAADCWDPLAALPSPGGPTDGVGGVGGGWFAVLGYDPGTCWLAFCDSLLRRRPDGTWVFESLGLAGRQQAAAAALSRARAALVSAERAGRPPRPAPTAPQPPAGIGPLSPVSDPTQVADQHVAGVERVIGRIRAGEVYQLNLCTRLTAPLLESPLELFVRTAGTVRPAYGAHLPTGADTALVSLSPERFLTVRDGAVITSPIKGTTKLSEDPDGSLLRGSSKDAAENIMITDLMRNDLSRVCRPGSVAVTGLLEIQAHPGVWHLVSTVTGRLGETTSVSDLLAATFPPGSVTGAPKSSAVLAIAAEEPVGRGTYTGAAGLITADGRAELSVLIRTFESHGARVELGVGGGITVDSVPVREWRECLHKAEPLALAAGSRLLTGLDVGEAPIPAALAESGVFESVLVQHGRPLRLADHLARLARSVRELYGEDLPTEIGRRALAAAATAAGDPRAALRVHARPSAAGVQVELSVRPLGPRLRICSLQRATRGEISWRHKWADRSQLDAAEERTTPSLPYFLDPKGRVAETSRGNLFVLGPDAIWRTPPSTDWVLPGVTRRALLDVLGDRRIPYEVAPVSVAELETARAIAWTSSLSGVITVRAVDGRARQHLDGHTMSGWLGISAI